LASDLLACDEAALLRRQGEALKVSLGQVRRGMAEVSLPDVVGPDSTVELVVAIDPARPPRETVDKLFKRAAKLERGRARIEQEIALNAERHRSLAALASRVETWWETAEDRSGIPEPLQEEARSLRVPFDREAAFQPTPGKPLSKKEEQRQQQMRSVRTFTSADGYEVYVGKSNVDNDTLSFRIARGNDWWFHLAPAAGSHVVVRNPSGGALPQETLLDASTLAVYYSKMRTATRAEVHYTQAKHVRRIRGAPPGKVRLERNQTLTVRMEEARLDRLVHRGHSHAGDGR
jgi:predicted ribosome quality control (RQC) complex YloA/Tae2 family protein